MNKLLFTFLCAMGVNAYAQNFHVVSKSVSGTGTVSATCYHLTTAECEAWIDATFNTFTVPAHLYASPTNEPRVVENSAPPFHEEHGEPACPPDSDTDGDGWGWDGVQGCQVTQSSAEPAVVSSLACPPDSDTDGDGWGWDGVQGCQVTQSSAEPAVVSSRACPPDSDTDGDGWGWDGVQGCQVTQSSAEPAVVSSRACPPDSDTDGDGWGWDGVQGCQVVLVSNELTFDTSGNLICPPGTNDHDNNGWGWHEDAQAGCVMQ